MNALILGTFALLSTLAQGADRVCTAQLPHLWTAELEAISAAVSELPLQPKESRGTACDPFDPKLKARTGLQKGKFINTTIKRNLMHLTDSEIGEFIGENKSGHQYVANLYHDDRFWIAEIPIDLKVNRLIYQSEEFLLGLTHGMMRVDLESPLPTLPAAQLFRGTRAGAHADFKLNVLDRGGPRDRRQVQSRCGTSYISNLALRHRCSRALYISKLQREHHGART